MAHILSLPFAEPISESDLEEYAENGFGELHFSDEDSAPESYDIYGPYPQIVAWLCSYYLSGSDLDLVDNIGQIQLSHGES